MCRSKQQGQLRKETLVPLSCNREYKRPVDLLRFDLNSCMSVPKHYTDRDLEWLIKEAASGLAGAAC